MTTRWHPAHDDTDWLRQALAWVQRAEREALAARGIFHIVLAGGDTPRRLYQALGAEAHDWGRWQVWLGDERCLPADDPQRNSVMVMQTLLHQAPAAQFHPIAAELGAERAAHAYAGTLRAVPEFDLVLLGLGQDGHTASLFPGQDWGQAATAADVLAVAHAPKPPPQRVSLSAQRLSRAHRVVFLVQGADKRPALARWQAGEPLPAAAIRPPGGVEVLLHVTSLSSGADS